MELLAAFVGGILGVIGAFAGVLLANYYQNRAQKQQTLRDTTISLYTELTGVEMLTSRMKASAVLDEAYKQKPLTISQLGTNVDKDFENWYHVGRVLNFFQKLGVYLRAGYLNKELGLELMGDTVMFWYDHYLTKMVRDVGFVEEPEDPFTYIDEWLKPYRAKLESTKERTHTNDA